MGLIEQLCARREARWQAAHERCIELLRVQEKELARLRLELELALRENAALRREQRGEQ